MTGQERLPHNMILLLTPAAAICFSDQRDSGVRFDRRTPDGRMRAGAALAIVDRAQAGF